MRAVALHGDVILVTSRLWQTNCVLVRRGEEAFCVDSPVLPDELELLPTVAEQSGFEVVGLLATHADWDHMLGRYAFRVPLGVAESTARVLREDPGGVQRELRAFDDEHYVERPGPLALGTPQELPVPGRCGLGAGELDLHPTGGHTADGMAIWVPWARVLVAGDHLSPVEIPMISPGGSAAAYLETLARLEPLVERAETVVPGHGEPLDGERALAILREDRAYLEALRAQGEAASLPLARRTAAQARIHARNAAAMAAA
ncbi:MAG TPA: MBL fold metallo-hydrolase [Solirubrobacteraceae bacterium]|nr:MBL fold metallo-hydrolase [Solirubrobacteraceae bacterium]